MSVSGAFFKAMELGVRAGARAIGIGSRIAPPVASLAYRGSAAVSKTAFTAAFTPLAVPAAAAIGMGRGVLKFGFNAGKSFGISRGKAVSSMVSDIRKGGLAGFSRVASAGTIPFTLGGAFGINALGKVDFIKDPRDRDPVNAMHLTQSLYNTLR